MYKQMKGKHKSKYMVIAAQIAAEKKHDMIIKFGCIVRNQTGVATWKFSNCSDGDQTWLVQK